MKIAVESVEISEPGVRTDWRPSVVEPAAFGVVTCLAYLGLAFLFFNMPDGFRGLSGWAGGNHIPWMSEVFDVSALVVPQFTFAEQTYIATTRLLLILFLILYGLSLWRVRAGGWDGRTLVAMGCCLALSATFVLPLFSGGTMLYSALGQSVIAYGANPFTTAPEAFPGDPVISISSMAHFTSTYGPFWILLSSGVMWVASSSPLAGVLLFKAVATAATIASGLLVYSLSGKLAPEQQQTAYAAFAFNPLVLLLGVGSVQLDVVIALFALLAVWFLVRGERNWAVVGHTLGVLIKISHLPLLALSIVGHRDTATLRDRALDVARAGLLSLAVLVAFWVPFWDGIGVFDSMLAEAERGHRNLFMAVPAVLIAELASIELLLAFQVIAAAGAVIIAGHSLRALIRPQNLHQEIHRWILVSAIVPLFWVRTQPWYWIVPLAMLAAAPPQSRWLWPGVFGLTAILILIRFTL